ncbi:MAG: hypothetical protein FWG68_06045, partial [Defluviitaleaceae bacterium]|nr:hypothetical protein [Defluviitaleaceae bacterium]
ARLSPIITPVCPQLLRPFVPNYYARLPPNYYARLPPNHYARLPLNQWWALSPVPHSDPPVGLATPPVRPYMKIIVYQISQQKKYQKNIKNSAVFSA